MKEEYEDCYVCRGTGISATGRIEDSCSACGGKGYTTEEDDREPEEPDYDFDYLADKAAEQYENSRINDNY